jgi:hypothetical protein
VLYKRHHSVWERTNSLDLEPKAIALAQKLKCRKEQPLGVIHKEKGVCLANILIDLVYSQVDSAASSPSTRLSPPNSKTLTFPRNSSKNWELIITMVLYTSSSADGSLSLSRCVTTFSTFPLLVLLSVCSVSMQFTPPSGCSE